MVRRGRGSLEQEIIAVLERTGAPMTVAEVNRSLDDTLAYTTVMTALARLHDKGVLCRSARGRGFAYELSGSVESLPAARAARHMRQLLDGHGARADVLARFVAELNADDEKTLLELLEHGGELPAAGGTEGA